MQKKYTDQLMEDIRHCTDIEKCVEKNQKYFFDNQVFSQYLDKLLKKYGKKMQDLINETDYSKPMLYHIKKMNEQAPNERSCRLELPLG